MIVSTYNVKFKVFNAVLTKFPENHTPTNISSWKNINLQLAPNFAECKIKLKYTHIEKKIVQMRLD